MGDGCGGQVGHDEVVIVLLVSFCWGIGRIYVWIVGGGRRRRADHGIGWGAGMGGKERIRGVLMLDVVGLQALGRSAECAGWAGWAECAECLSGEARFGLESGLESGIADGHVA